MDLSIRFHLFASTDPPQTHCLQRARGPSVTRAPAAMPLMNPTLATPHLRDLREVLHEAIQQAQDAIRRTRELLRHADEPATPEAAPEPDERKK